MFEVLFMPNLKTVYSFSNKKKLKILRHLTMQELTILNRFNVAAKAG
jgi:hypothetical protein